MSKARAIEIVLEARTVSCLVCQGSGQIITTDNSPLKSNDGLRVIGEVIHPKLVECGRCGGKGYTFLSEYYAALALLGAGHD